MKDRFVAFIVSCALVSALAVSVFQSEALAAGSACPSGGTPAPGSKVNAGLTVDGNCVITNVTINGGVVIKTLGHLTISDSTINGGVTAEPNSEFDSSFPSGAPNAIHGGVTLDHPWDVDIRGSTVDGTLMVNGLTIRPGFFVIISICGATLNGGVTLQNFPASPNGAQVGDPGETDLTNCAPNTIRGGVNAVNSAGSRIEVEKNTISGSVTVDDSTPSVAGNTITGSLSCTNGGALHIWDADDTEANSINGSNSC